MPVSAVPPPRAFAPATAYTAATPAAAHVAEYVRIHVPLKPITAATRLKRQRVELGRQVGRVLVRCEPHFAPAVPARLVPQLEAITLTDQHSGLPEACEFAQLGRNQHPSGPVELHIGGVTHHEPLKLARLRVQAR